MNPIMQAFPLAQQRTTFWAVNGGFNVLGLDALGPHRWVLAEVDPSRELEMWAIVLVENGEALPIGGEYIGSFITAEKDTKHIQVAGSAGLQQQNDAILHIWAAYLVRPEPAEIPEPAADAFAKLQAQRSEMIAQIATGPTA